jgi:crotonobetaine/carnitine-CoA ligase
MAAFLRQSPELPDDHDNPLRHVVMSPIPPWIDEFKKRFDVQVGTAFGSTEIAYPIVSGDTYEVASSNHESCGKADADSDFQLVDEHGRKVAAGEIGELVVRGKPWEVNLGYWRLPEVTDEAWRGGWFHTGDLMRRDEEGYYYFVDRAKDAIRRRGENISSFEIENAVNLHPEVSSCAAFGVASEHGEQEVMVVAVLLPHAQLQPGELHEFLRGKLPHFAVPRYIEFADALPTTPTSRARKFVLRERGVTAFTWERPEERRAPRSGPT